MNKTKQTNKQQINKYLPKKYKKINPISKFPKQFDANGHTIFRFKIQQVPAFFHQKQFIHLWNHPDFNALSNETNYSILRQKVKDDLSILSIFEFVCGDRDHWSWNLEPRFNLLIELSNPNKKLTYLKSTYLNDQNQIVVSDWSISHQTSSLIDYLKIKGNFIEYEDNNMCVLYIL